MKKQFGKLSKEKQEKSELEHHRMKPKDFDQLMTKAKRYSPPVLLAERTGPKVQLTDVREGLKTIKGAAFRCCPWGTRRARL